MTALSRLKRLGNEWAKRPQIIAEARAEKATWQEIADALHMTPHGVRKLHASGQPADLVWVERGGDTWYLRSRPYDSYPAGRSHPLERFKSLHDDDSMAEIDAVVATWGWDRVGPMYLDDMGAYQVPVSRSPR